jgi:hypothetical protein
MRRSIFLPVKESAAGAGADASSAAAITPALIVLEVDDIDASAGCGCEPRRKLGHPRRGDNRGRERPNVQPRSCDRALLRHGVASGAAWISLLPHPG